MYEYKVIPAPAKGIKARGIKGAEAQFSHGFETVLNDMGRKGWEFQRAETVPSTERKGLTSSRTVYRSILVFRRLADETTADRDPAPVVKFAAPASTETGKREPQLSASRAAGEDAGKDGAEDKS